MIAAPKRKNVKLKAKCMYDRLERTLDYPKLDHEETAASTTKYMYHNNYDMLWLEPTYGDGKTKLLKLWNNISNQDLEIYSVTTGLTVLDVKKRHKKFLSPQKKKGNLKH